MAKQVAKLSPEVADKYSLRKIKPGVHQVAGFGPVDFRTVSLRTADALHAAGCTLLVRKPQRQKKAKESVE